MHQKLDGKRLQRQRPVAIRVIQLFAKPKTEIPDESRGIDELGMTRIAEQFFISLGFEPLPQTFWERSLFTKPRDRDVVCYASAWQLDGDDDVRLKMCIQRNGRGWLDDQNEGRSCGW